MTIQQELAKCLSFPRLAQTVLTLPDEICEQIWNLNAHNSGAGFNAIAAHEKLKRLDAMDRSAILNAWNLPDTRKNVNRERRRQGEKPLPTHLTYA